MLYGVYAYMSLKLLLQKQAKHQLWPRYTNSTRPPQLNVPAPVSPLLHVHSLARSLVPKWMKPRMHDL